MVIYGGNGMSCHVRITGFHDVFVRVPIYYCNAVFSYPFYNNNLTDERPEANEQIGGVWGGGGTVGGLSSTGLARRCKTNKSVNRVPVRPNEELSVRGRSTLMSGGIKHVLGPAVYLLATVNYRRCDERRDRLLHVPESETSSIFIPLGNKTKPLLSTGFCSIRV